MEYSLPRGNEILERTPAVLNTLLLGISEEWTNTNEGPDTWSVFDIVGHLIWGEKTDWVPRAQLILSGKENRAFIPFDRFAQFRESKGKTLAQLLEEFEKLRKENLQILKGLNISTADLHKTGIHPAFGEVTLSQLLSTWVAHDLNHIAQIARVMAKQYKDAAGPWVEYLKILQ